jgi:hypothetical protein
MRGLAGIGIAAASSYRKAKLAQHSCGNATTESTAAAGRNNAKAKKEANTQMTPAFARQAFPSAVQMVFNL